MSIRPSARHLAARRAGVLSLAAIAGLLLHCAPRPDAASDSAAAPVELPGIEGWTGEAQVAAKIEQARREALDNPGSAELVGRVGMIFQAHDLHAEALVCYRRAAALAIDESRWPYLAAVSLRTDDLEESVGLFEEAAARGMDHPAYHVNFGNVLAQLGRVERAETEYRRALEIDPEVTHALYGLAQLALARGEPEAARVHLEQAAGIAPWHGQVHTLLAQTYQRLGRPEDAERELKAAGAHPEAAQAADPILEQVEAEAVTSLAYTRRARRLAREGRFAEAEALYREVLEIRPAKAADYSNLGGTLAGQGKIDDAIQLYEKALALDDDDPYALNNLAMALAQKGDREGAVELLERALAIEPTYPEAHHNLGLVRAGQRRFAEAVEHYRQALFHDPSWAPAHNDMGTALAALGDLDGALRHWRQALEIDPRQLSALYNLSVALARRGDHAEAIGRLRRGLDMAPDSSRLASFLAWELATAPAGELRDGAEAVDLARRVHEAYPGQPAAGDVLAAALAETGDFEAAIAVAERALQQARSARQGPLVGQIEMRLEIYRRGRSFRQPAGGAG
jgi:tetratricopeptide (TPR) repeat protein